MVVKPEQCFIITNRDLLDITRGHTGGYIPEDNIIPEPERRNTAACIAYATLLLHQKYDDGVFCFVPADGYVEDCENYSKALKSALDTAAYSDRLVIIGVKPTYPATGYGYIHVEPESETGEKPSPVLDFVEKPDAETAQKLVLSSEYLWNCGIVAGSANVFIQHIRQHLPEHYRILSGALQQTKEKGLYEGIEEAYQKIPGISFDNGVLEKSHSLYAVRASFDWDDIGSIDALAKTLKSDTRGNRVEGRHIGINTTNSIIYADGIAICTIDVNNMVVAGTKEAVVVCSRNKSQEIKKLVEKLKQTGNKDLL
jgi:mannose-1-phosphate guanylyltransferase